MSDDRDEQNDRRASSESAGSLDDELQAALGAETDPGSDYDHGGDDHYDDDYDAPTYEQSAEPSQSSTAVKGQRSQEATLGQAASSSQSDYSYFDQALGKNWAGPEHWRMRRIIQSMSLC